MYAKQFAKHIHIVSIFRYAEHVWPNLLCRSSCHMPSLVPCIASPTEVGLFAWRFARMEMYTSRNTVYPKISNMPVCLKSIEQNETPSQNSSMLDKYMLKACPKQCLASITRTAAWMRKVVEILAICSALGCWMCNAFHRRDAKRWPASVSLIS